MPGSASWTWQGSRGSKVSLRVCINPLRSSDQIRRTASHVQDHRAPDTHQWVDATFRCLARWCAHMLLCRYCKHKTFEEWIGTSLRLRSYFSRLISFGIYFKMWMWGRSQGVSYLVVFQIVLFLRFYRGTFNAVLHNNRAKNIPNYCVLTLLLCSFHSS